VPIGAEENFEGVVDLVQDEGDLLDEASQGMKFDLREIRLNSSTPAKMA